MEGHFLEVPGYSVPGTSYSVPSTNYEVPPTQSVVPATNYEAPGSIMAAMPPGMGGYSAPSTRYDVPGSNDRTVMTDAAPLQSAELTPASTFATTFSSNSNEVPFMKYAAPMDPLHSYGSPVSSFQPPASLQPLRNPSPLGPSWQRIQNWPRWTGRPGRCRRPSPWRVIAHH